MGWLVPITIIGLVALCQAFILRKRYNDMIKLKQWVAWSVCDPNSNLLRHRYSLWEALRSAQIRSNIREEYRISGTNEWSQAKVILAEFQEYLAKAYFSDQLWVLQSKYVIDSDHYFIYMLYVFLSELNEYSMTVVHRKMRYIAYMYCRYYKASPLKDRMLDWVESTLQEALDQDLSLRAQNDYVNNCSGEES